MASDIIPHKNIGTPFVEVKSDARRQLGFLFTQKMKNDDHRRGIWIPIELMNNKKLDWPNKVLLAEIYYLNKLPNGCFGSNDFFANLLGTERSAASKRITSLKKNGYIQTEDIFDKGNCVGRVITPLFKIDSYEDYIKVSHQSKSNRSITAEELPEHPDDSSIKKPAEVPEQPENCSVENQGVVPERLGGSSQTTRG